MPSSKVWTFTILKHRPNSSDNALVQIPPERMRECSFLSSPGRNPRVLFCFGFGQTLKHFCHSGEITIVVFISISLLMSCIKNRLAICVPFSLNCLFLFFGHFYIGSLIFYNWFARVKLAFYPLCAANIHIFLIVIYGVAFKLLAFSFSLGPWWLPREGPGETGWEPWAGPARLRGSAVWSSQGC